MGQLVSFIEKGKEIYGSYGGLANEIGVPQSHISMWKSGAKPCTAPDRAALALAVGEDPAEAAIEAALEGINLEKPQGKRAAHALALALERIRKHHKTLVMYALRKIKIQGFALDPYEARHAGLFHARQRPRHSKRWM